MGKNLKGKELGKGICQKKDGTYLARFVGGNGKRIEKCFKVLPEARNWLEEARHKDACSGIVLGAGTTVDEWYEFWIKNIVGNRAYDTIRNYRERYEINIRPIVGNLVLQDLKPLHCSLILRKMEEQDYAGATIKQTYTILGTILKAAYENEMIPKNVMNGVKCPKNARAVDDIRFLTVDEQNKLLQVAKRSHNYFQYCFVLDTGLRTSELIGLTWDKVDLSRREITVNKTLKYRYKTKLWEAGPPKSMSSYRTIPLTDRAYEILSILKVRAKDIRRSPELNQTLEFRDLKSGRIDSFNMNDLVFINYRTGMPAKNSSYDTHLYKLCEKAEIERISMHGFRHTFATRAIERDVQPKVLQRILGHSSLQMTMDRYVHVSDESMFEAIRRFEGKA